MTQPDEKKKWLRGDTIPIRVTSSCWNESTGEWDAVDCDAGYPKVTLYKPDGVTKAVDDQQATVHPETGVYYYMYSTSVSSETGVWRATGTVKYTPSGFTAIYKVDVDTFTLE